MPPQRSWEDPHLLVSARLMSCSVVLVALFAFAACGGGGHEVEEIGPGLAIGTLAPDFQLPDVNPNSPTYNTLVSPRQRLNKISAWYFAHAT